MRGQRIEAENPKCVGKRVDGFVAESLVARLAPCPQKNHISSFKKSVF
jgi:hypothetical protein